MTTNNQTINISKDNIYGKCDLKCSYNFDYTSSNTVATNNGISVSLTYDKGNKSPVIFNNKNYFVSTITLYSPSIHSFNGTLTKGELVIIHSPELGGDQLFVCIPIIQSSQSTEASDNLTEIIQGVLNNAPSNGETTNINISDFNLNNFVPKKPYYNYTGLSGLVGQVIVFSQKEAIPLSETSITNLSKIIQPVIMDITGGNLFFNPDGPNSSNGNKEGIYISCQPTGNSIEETEVTYTNTTNYNLFQSNQYTKIIVQLLIGCAIFIILFLIINYGFKALSPNEKVTNYKGGRRR